MTEPITTRMAASQERWHKAINSHLTASPMTYIRKTCNQADTPPRYPSHPKVDSTGKIMNTPRGPYTQPHTRTHTQPHTPMPMNFALLASETELRNPSHGVYCRWKMLKSDVFSVVHIAFTNTFIMCLSCAIFRNVLHEGKRHSWGSWQVQLELHRLLNDATLPMKS